MAPTICEDDLEVYAYQNSNRILRHRSVINYVGHQLNRKDEASDEVASSAKNRHIRRDGEHVPNSSERRTSLKRRSRENRIFYESDDSSSSIPSPMTFHNYAKRRKFSESDDDSENYISTSSESNEKSPVSSSNDDSDRENIRVHSLSYLLPPSALANGPMSPYSPVSSSTDAITLYRRLSRASPRHINSFHRQDLMEIAMKTIILLQKNRSLHARLNQLKLETRAFVNSVMSNPENAKLRQTINQSNDKMIDHPSNKILAIKNQ